jgi:hypothetical protein
MRSAGLRPLGRFAIVVGVAAAALAVTVPISLGRETAGGPVTNYLTYVGGTAGKANPKLSPIVIGAINTQGGQVLVGPNWTKGAELAVKYVNTYLGGSADPERGYEIARRVRSGSVTVNGMIVDYKMPFGGFKQSGIGREGGVEGLEPYFEVKTVYFG